MNLKNYTSTVPAITSMGRIEKALVSAGATNISKTYEDQVCTSITFRMVITGDIPMFFKMPAKVEPCFNVLWEEVKRPRPDTKRLIRDQAERTAWKIVADWVEIQLSMIMLQQAEPLQVFLPYAYDPKTDSTFYEKLKTTGYKALLSN